MQLCHCHVALPLSYYVPFVMLYWNSCDAFAVIMLQWHSHVALPLSYHVAAVGHHCYSHGALYLLCCFVTFRWL